MKAFVVVVLLLLQQVMGDTQLVTQASNQFANDLYQKLAETPDNVLVCPISLHVALTLLLQGAGGTTATELATVLKLGAASNADVKEGYKAILTGIQDDVLKIANKLYPAAGYQLSPDYLSVAREYFLSDVQGLNYSNPSLAASTINDFVAEKTNNKIRDLISADTITDLTRLIIVNAVHFQATWKSTFTTAYEDYFKVTPDKRVKTKLMTQTGYFGYKEDPALDAKVLKMDYDKEGYSMVFILPNKEDGLQAMEAKLAETSLESILKDLRDTRVEVTIPKFKVEQTLKLKDILQKMGLKDVFSSKANLHGVANGDNLYVSDVIQKTFINVHENGTEAAAATVFLETLSANPDLIIFYATRPFLYYLIHSNRSLILFGGRFLQPLENSPTARPVASQEDSIVFEDKFLNNQPEQKPKQPNMNKQAPTTQTVQQQNQQGQQSNQQWKQPNQQSTQQWQQQNQPGQQQTQQWQQQNQPGQQQTQQWQQPNQQGQQPTQQWQNHNQQNPNGQQTQNFNSQRFYTQNPYQPNQAVYYPQVVYTGQPGYPQPVPQQHYQNQDAVQNYQQGYNTWNP